MTIDEPSLLHVDGQVVATTGVAGRRVAVSAGLRSAGGFLGQVSTVQVPIPAGGSSLAVLNGFITEFGVGAGTIPPGTYELTLDANAGGLCDPSVMEFTTGPSRLSWFTAKP